jgi:hypothetical protein
MADPNGGTNARSTAVQSSSGGPGIPRQPSIPLTPLNAPHSQSSNAYAATNQTRTSPTTRSQNDPRGPAVPNASASQPGSTASHQTQRQPSSDGSIQWNLFITKLTTALSFLALAAALIFSISAWIGMNYANKYAAKGYQLSLWQACHNHDVRLKNVCRS